MRKKLVIVLLGLLCFALAFSNASNAGINADAKIKIKLIRESQIADTSINSITTGKDTILNLNAGESFWLKAYLQNVDSLSAWEINIPLNTSLLSYDPSSSANYKLTTSAAGEKEILIKKDTSGMSSTTDVTTYFNKYESGEVKIFRTVASFSKLSNPALLADTGFVFEIKLTAASAVSVNDSTFLKATKILLFDYKIGDDLLGVAASDSAKVKFMPIELSSFAGVIIGESNIKLTWTTASELNNLGFYVERSLDGIKFEQVGFVSGNGTTNQEMTYSFSDNSMAPGKYYYRLKNVDISGAASYSDVIEVAVGAPAEYTLLQNYPNPFNPKTTIKFSLRDGGSVKLQVYNLLGQLVATLADGKMNAGYHAIDFDATRLSSGIYFYTLQVNNYKSSRKMVILK